MNRTIFQESWFPLVNALSITIANCQIVLGMFFILIVLCNRTCQSVPNFLAVNTVLTIMFYAVTILAITIHIWQCDIYSNKCMSNGLCFFRNYVNDVASTAAFYSLAIQSIDRLLVVVYGNKVRFRTYKIRITLCVIQWLIAFLFPIYFIYLTPQLAYDPISYICVVPHNCSLLLTIYTIIFGSLIPFIIIISIYLRLFLFIRRLRRSTTLQASSLSSKRELRMVKRILILLAILILGSIPGIIFGSIKPPPIYEYRIYYLSVISASLCCTICIFCFTYQVRQWWIGKLRVYISPRIAPTTQLRTRY